MPHEEYGVEVFLSFCKILGKLNNRKSTSDHFKPVYQVNNQYPFSLSISKEEFRQKTNNVTLHFFTLHLLQRESFYEKILYMYKNWKILFCMFCQYHDLNLAIYLLCLGLFIIHLPHSITVVFCYLKKVFFLSLAFLVSVYCYDDIIKTLSGDVWLL